MPTPGPDTVKYGGNTSCIEIRSDNNDLLILDAGTGLHSLGKELADDGPLVCNLFITHTHWDHIHGLPFFAPLYASANKIIIHGPPDPISMVGVESALTSQMRYPFFPVREAELNADIEYVTLTEGDSVDLGFATVQTILLNHPAMNLGYKVTCDGKTLFFTGDHETYYNIYQPEDAEYAEYKTLVAERTEEYVSFLSDADVLIADAQYTDEEYVSRQGWGHSSCGQTIDLAIKAGVGRVFLTHHETSRTDSDLETIQAGLNERLGELDGELRMAKEGDEVQV
jgi:phosphoribosyl 1,2-cyclic phosphodiesterase